MYAGVYGIFSVDCCFIFIINLKKQDIYASHKLNRNKINKTEHNGNEVIYLNHMLGRIID